MAILFEYDKWTTVDDPVALRKNLEQIWSQRLLGADVVDWVEEGDESAVVTTQPFLRFNGDQIRANNFSGFIQSGDQVIEIFPKVFRHLPDPESSKISMLRHVFYWFEFCRRWRFPFNLASLSPIDTDSFPELIINLVARQLFDVVSNQPLSLYQPVAEALATPRGRINFSRYATTQLSRGNFHQVECDYEPFLFDNKVNRIIKYCSRLLSRITKLPENIQILGEILFVLDEVEDHTYIASDLDGIKFNTLYSDYVTTLEVCRIVLDQQLYSSDSYRLPQWCLLFPMEYIFEDFVAGFIESHFGEEWVVEYQKSDQYVADSPRAFRMQHDIFLTSRTNCKKIIIDTKYKLRDPSFKSDVKRGIVQSDLYQMVTYAVKRGCSDVLLLYPNINDERLHSSDKFQIKCGLVGTDEIRLTAAEIPFWSMHNFTDIGSNLQSCLSTTLQNLHD